MYWNKAKKVLGWLPLFILFFGPVAFGFPQLVTELEAKRDKPVSEEHFTFVVWGDNQPKNDFGQPRVFKKIITEVNRIKPDFVISLGDVIYGRRDEDSLLKHWLLRLQWMEYLATIKPLQCPIYHVAGNHDICYSRNNRAIFEQLFGHNLYYSFMYKNCFFIILASEIPGQDGKIEGEQLEWLKQELTKTKTATFTFVFIHQPFYSVLKTPTHRGIEPANRQILAKLCKDYQVDMVFAGHEHIYHSGKWDGLQQIISGGAGGTLHPYPGPNFHHYLVVTVSGKKVRVEAKPINQPGSD